MGFGSGYPQQDTEKIFQSGNKMAGDTPVYALGDMTPQSPTQTTASAPTAPTTTAPAPAPQKTAAPAPAPVNGPSYMNNQPFGPSLVDLINGGYLRGNASNSFSDLQSAYSAYQANNGGPSTGSPTAPGSTPTGGGSGSPTTVPGGSYVNPGAPGSSGNMSPAQSHFFNNNSNITDPFQANQNMASTIASYGAQSIPGAAMFQQGLFEPGFNAMENAFLNSEGERQMRLLNSQMAGLGNKFSGTPFHSGYLNMSRELGAQAASGLGQSAQQLALNRQGLAAQAAQRVLGSPMQATEQAQNVTPSMLQLISQMQMLPLQAGSSYLQGTPIFSPTIIPGVQSI